MRYAWVVALVGVSAAQAWDNDAAAVLSALERDRGALADYRWTSRTEVALDGVLTEVALVEARATVDGTIVTSPLPSPAAAAPGKRWQRRIHERRQAVQALLDDYTALGTEPIRKAFAAALVTRGEPGQLTLIQARDVMLNGDSMKLMVEPDSLHPRRLELLTSLDGEPVRFETEFGELEGGASYPARTTVDTEIRERRMIVTTENYDFVREAGAPERGP
jgi:hypothetical protein